MNQFWWIFWRVEAWANDKLIRFWWQPRTRSRSRNIFKRYIQQIVLSQFYSPGGSTVSAVVRTVPMLLVLFLFHFSFLSGSFRQHSVWQTMLPGTHYASCIILYYLRKWSSPGHYHHTMFFLIGWVLLNDFNTLLQWWNWRLPRSFVVILQCLHHKRI